MAARKADPRIGHLLRTVSDFGDDLARSPRLRHIIRWRLEKKNPAAVALGRLGGLKGGKARAARLSEAERSESAKKAAAARWAGRRKKG